MAALIVFNDGTPHTGTVDGGSLTEITLSNFDNTGVLGWAWTIIYRPIGSGAVLSSATSPTPTFTPDVRGTYLVRLFTYTDVGRTILDNADEQCYAIRLSGVFDWRIPAAQEKAQFDADAGWALAVEDLIRDVHLALIKNNLLTEVIPPGVGNDNTENYSRGSIWIDHFAEEVYVATNVATGAAIWQRWLRLSAIAPANVTKAAAAAGTGFEAAREDHKHDVLTDSAAAIAGRAVSAEGTSSALARADHVHQIALAVTVASATPHTLAAETCVLVVDTSVSIDVQLPAPSNVGALIPVLIIDRENNASLKPISLLRAAAEEIDGVAATRVLDVDGGRWWLWTNGTDWFTAACLPVDVAKLAGIEAGADVTDATNVAAAGAVMASDNAILDADFAGVALGRLTRTGAGAYAVIKDYLVGAVSAPTVTDDSAAGYQRGSIWIDHFAEEVYVATDVAAGAAVWQRWIRLSDFTPVAVVGLGDSGTGAGAARSDHVHPAIATIETESGTARNMAAADAGKVIRCTAATTVTITVPAALTPGVTVEYVQEGAGQVQVVGSGVTLRLGATFNPYTAEQWSSLVVTVLDTDEALVRGDLAAV